jgi:hypothetical protein
MHAGFCAHDKNIDYCDNRVTDNTNTGDDSYDADDGSNDNAYNQYTLQQTLGVTNAS